MTSSHPELDRRLAALREAASQWTPPASVDAAIASAAARARRNAGRVALRTPRPWIVVPLALAASIAVLAFIVRSLPPRTPDAAPAAAAAHPTFTPVVPMTAIADSSDAYVVTARVPRMTFAQFGVPVDPARPDVPIDAELLVRRDGALLAYRLVD